MANPGIGNKFVSVNLNKSYGQPSSSLGSAAASRARPGGHGGGGGGLVVLSRPRSSIVGAQKGGAKLSVPPPLNLPSLRKEHERFDSSSTGGGSTGAGSSGSGSRPTSSGMGWTKPAPSTLQQKDGGGDQSLLGRSGGATQEVDNENQPSYPTDGASRVSSVYIPPSVRSGVVGNPVASSARAYPPVEKAVVLRGEDFPSLQATLPTTSGPVQKQKDPSHQKQKQKVGEEVSDEETAISNSRPLLDMRPQMQPSRRTVGNGSNENGSVSRGSGVSSTAEQSRKQDEYFSGPLPLVRLNHTSDWADDERDTGHNLPDRDKDHGFSRSEVFRNRDFDIPRGGLPPRTHVDDISAGRGVRDDEVGGQASSREVLRVDPYGRDVRTPSKEGRDGSSWRASSLSNDGYGPREVRVDRNGVVARPFSQNREMNVDNKYNQSSFGDNSRDGFSNGVLGTQDLRFGRRDLGYGQGSRQNGKHAVESYIGREAEQNMRDRHGGDLSNRYRGGDTFRNRLIPRTSFSLGGKGLSVNDPILLSERDKRSFSNSGKPYHEDPFLKVGNSPGFDERDFFSGGPVGVFKKKKDVLKQADFHDPVRESFEAELERVQRMQEQERQRIIEEQARALELARKEEEERERLAREEEEQRRRLEEEAREAAWRAEQERLEASRRAEEHKRAREEEKRRIFMEEERRKEAARKKLLELEARMSRRQAETVKDDNYPAAVGEGKMPRVVKEKDVPMVADVGDWEDGERMVERITGTASSDSSSMNRSFEIGSRPQSSRDGNFPFLDRGNPANSWRRDVFENVNNSTFLPRDQENGISSPRQDAFGAGRVFPRKEFYVGPGDMSARTSSKGGVSEPSMVGDFPHVGGHRWNLPVDGDHYSRNLEIDAEIHENTADRYGDMGWGQGRFRGSPYAPYPERLYQNSEADGFSNFGRSRHSMRQPRVLPPPSLAPMHKNSFRCEAERPSSSAFLDSEMRYHHAPRSEPIMQTGYVSGYQENFEQPGIMEAPLENTVPEEHKLEKTAAPRCESQSSLSVSSPPNSPTHLSHDDLDDSGDFSVLPATAGGKGVPLSDNEPVESTSDAGNANMKTASGSVSPDEDEEWSVENNDDLQEQEEYDEEEDGYQEEDEVHEGDVNVDLTREFEGLHLEEKDTSDKMGQLVLGFNEGVEVELPSGDELERTSKIEEKAIGIEQMSVGIAEEPGSFDELVGIGQSLQPEDSLPDISIENSSKTIEQAEKAVQDLVLQPVNAAHNTVTSGNFLLDSVEASSSSLLVLQPVASSVNMALSSPPVQSVMSSVSAVPNKADVPVKLQFGLFSGPSLIPSPVPAIQIGSIQMPLHLHPPVGPSLTQIHPSQPPFFQFGQLRYTSPISQGIFPLTPQSMPFVQPTIPGHYSMNQNQGGPLQNQAGQDTSAQNSIVKDKESSVMMDSQPGLVPKLLDLSQENECKEVNVSPVRESSENGILASRSRAESSLLGEKKIRPDSISQDQGHYEMAAKKNYRSIANNRESQGPVQSESTSSQFIPHERAFSVSKAPGPISGGKGKNFIFTGRNSGSRTIFRGPETAHTDTTGFQRRSRRNIRHTEFRVRENVDRRQTEGVVSSDSGLDGKPNLNGKVLGISAKSGAKKDAILAKPSKQTVESEPLAFGSIISRVVDSESKMEKGLGKEAPTKRATSSLGVTRSREGNLKRNNSFDEDFDAPLQSGIVRVFKQPGIEAPSDEDDFIEVRSKRQMLNDRREQREKENKAKSRVIKAPRRPRSVSQNKLVSTHSNKISTSLGGETASNIRSESVVIDGRALANVEVSVGFTSTMISQPLPPIGTPAVNTDAKSDMRSHTIKSKQTGPTTGISNGGANLSPGLSFENKNVVLDNVQTSLGSWGNARMDQQVMALTQTQLEEAMNPARFDAHVASIGEHTNAVIEPSKPSPSISTQEKSFSSTASPLNSLLAGEKIQFGAVTSPTILPPGSLAVSTGIVLPPSCRSDVPIDLNLSAAGSDCTLFFEKDEHPDDSCVHLEDAEAEAEAAASAVAVAAISSDEIVGNGLGSCSVSVSEAKSFGGADINGLPMGSGVAGDQQLTGQSRGEESLTVALPADLSVETPSLSLWPSLPSPQNSSSQMLSHFPGVPPSHFPCYEMNPMLGGPIFAFGPHDESAGTQSQSQKSSTSASGPLGAWQQCHSGVDSFYGSPAGFTGPFISPPGGIPGVQGPPHMFVYNHFAPVGQFGQVGLSFMGTTYIPSGKQPDWKHNPTSSALGIGEGDINNLNMVSAQRNTPNMPAPIQHLAPGSPLLSMASPLAMFDMSPFQSSADIPVQARWSHVAASPLHSVPLSMPSQQQAESVLPSQFHGLPVEQSSTGNRFHEPIHSSAPPEFPVATNASATQFPDELGLVDPSSSTTRVSTSRPTSNSSTRGSGKAQSIVTKSSSRSTITNAGESGSVHNNNNNNSNQSMSSGFKVQSSHQQTSSTQQYLHPSGYTDQRAGGVSQKVSSGGEWSHRRMGFQGRNQSLGADKNFSSSKIKQIYVAKPATSGTSTAV